MNETVQLRVTGMTCGGCENAVRRAVGNLLGVTSVTASYQQAMVGVTYDPENVTPATIREKIEQIGYHVQG